MEVTNRFKGLYLIDRVPEELWTEVHKSVVQEAVIKTILKKKKCKKAKWLSEEALQIAEKRKDTKGKGEKERYTHLNAEFQTIARRDKKAFLSDQCKEIEENNRMGNTRDLFKKIRDTKGTFHAKMGTIQDRHGMDLAEAEDIKRRWQEYTEELYKKDLHDPDSQDGVITHLVPDILECKIKWALGSITTKKLIEVMEFSTVQFSCSVVSNSLRTHEPQHAWPPCPSPTPGVHPNLCPLSQGCHPTISSSVIPFSFCPQSFPASGTFQMSQLFPSGGQSIGVSASTSVLPMNTQD